jgi:hypothetical protein
MADGIGSTASWLAGVAVGAGIICWGVLPAMVGLGTQRSPQNADLAKPGDVAQWFAANVARVSGDFSVTFMRDRAQGAVAGSNNLNGDGRGRQLLPQSYTLPDAARPQPVSPTVTRSGLSGTSHVCVSSHDRNCDGLISLDELEQRP